MFVKKSSMFDLLKVTKNNEHIIAMVVEACWTVPELNIIEDALVDARLRKLVAGVHKAWIELAKVQFELNLKIIELELRAQTSSPPEVREQCETIVKDAIIAVDTAVKDCTTLIEKVLKVVTSLQEDLELQRLEIEARELQQRYDEVEAMAHIITIT